MRKFRICDACCCVWHFAHDLRGTAALEFAICFPVLIVLFFQYMGISADMRLVETFERSTACLATVLANTEPVTIPPGNSETDAYRYTLFGGGFSDAILENTFLSMMGNPNIKGTIRITYSAGPGAEGRQRLVSLNGGNLLHETGDKSLAEYRASAQAVSSDSSYKYPHRLIRVEARIDNPVKGKSWLLVDSFFPSQYQSSFVAVRSK